MNGAFIREFDGEEESAPQERVVGRDPNYITAEGYERLSSTASRLQLELERIGDAVEGQVDQAQLERDVQYLQGRLRSAIVVPAVQGVREKVAFGATVIVAAGEAAQRQSYRIVGVDEVSELPGNISWASPLARALLGSRVGDIVSVERPAGEIEMEILEIR